MFVTCILGLTLAAAPAELPSPLRTDPPPKEWRVAEIDAALPFPWERGTVHVLAWEVVTDDRPFQYTQVLVLKRFDRLTEKAGRRWALVHLYLDPENPERPWRGPMRIPPPPPPGQQEPPVTETLLYGWDFYAGPPTDEQVQAFLRETDWTPTLGTDENSIAGDRPVTTSLAAGGMEPAAWKKALGREVPARLFPELQKPAG